VDREDVDWLKIKTEYITDPRATYRNLAQKYGVPKTNLERRAKKEGWVGLRRQTEDKAVALAVSEYEKKQAKKMETIDRIANKLLRKIEKAVDELDLQLVTNVTKTKTIEYNNDKRPDKPTKEVIEEKAVIGTIHTIIDKQGVRTLAAALRDLKDAKGILSPIEVREKEAQIDNLRSKLPADSGGEEDEGGVIMLSTVDEAPKEAEGNE
jgi:transposase-like protein